MKIEGKQNIWKEYQKEIAEDHFFYVRSCVRQNFFPGSEKTFLRILQYELKKDLFENPSHTTCSGIGYHTDIIPFETSMTMVARQFALMTEAGYENLVTSCITSFGLYSEVLETWHHFPELEEKTRQFLRKATGREFKKPANVSHASDIIFKFRKEIAEKSKYSLVNKDTGKPLRVVEHIGCHYSKMFPSKGIGGAEYPYVLVGMIEDWGGEVIDYPERRHCCGFGFRQYLVQANRGFSISCSKKKFDSMEPYKPDMILTNCPGCPMFLDRWQYAISEMEGKTYGENNQGIPVLTYEELAGLVLGYNPWDLGLQVHQVPAEPLLDKMGIPYDPEMKFRGADGQDLGKPEAPTTLKFYAKEV
ncbi:MAG: heterodisulfide reductase-related iron-sulfur binding cluster [Bacteroidetes bacterium]|nr:heterodisulfide reductase-related iron-sulfur binding cluster [Bacteroidota bacterium]